MINFDGGADKTDDIEDCGNKGCGFNIAGKCTASGTECFGYIDPDWDSKYNHTIMGKLVLSRLIALL